MQGIRDNIILIYHSTNNPLATIPRSIHNKKKLKFYVFNIKFLIGFIILLEGYNYIHINTIEN